MFSCFVLYGVINMRIEIMNSCISLYKYYKYGYDITCWPWTNLFICEQIEWKHSTKLSEYSYNKWPSWIYKIRMYIKGD